jgi:hypothetical protein
MEVILNWSRDCRFVPVLFCFLSVIKMSTFASAFAALNEAFAALTEAYQAVTRSRAMRGTRCLNQMDSNLLPLAQVLFPHWHEIVAHLLKTFV